MKTPRRSAWPRLAALGAAALGVFLVHSRTAPIKPSTSVAPSRTHAIVQPTPKSLDSLPRPSKAEGRVASSASSMPPTPLSAESPTSLPVQQYSAPPEFGRFAEIGRKVIHSQAEVAEWHHLLKNRALRSRALAILSERLSESDRLDTVAYLTAGLQSDEPSLRAEFAGEISPYLSSADLESGAPSERRQRAADVAELTLSCLVVQPQSLSDLLVNAKPLNRIVIERAADYIKQAQRQIGQIREPSSAR